jgi:hypothetical protein
MHPKKVDKKSKKGFFKYETFENFSKMFSFFLQKQMNSFQDVQKKKILKLFEENKS